MDDRGGVVSNASVVGLLARSAADDDGERRDASKHPVENGYLKRHNQ